MHFEPIFKEGVITVDNVATVAAYKNAISVMDNVISKYSEEFKQILESQAVQYKSLYVKILSLKGKWSRDGVEVGQKYIEPPEYFFNCYTVRTKSGRSSGYFEDTSSFVELPSIHSHYLIDKKDLKEKVSTLLSVASRAIHPFAVNTEQAGFITTCDEMTEEAVIGEIRNSFEKKQKELDECSDKIKEITHILESQLITKSVKTKEDPFVSVFSPKSDSRSVWQWIKDTLKGE